MTREDQERFFELLRAAFALLFAENPRVSVGAWAGGQYQPTCEALLKRPGHGGSLSSTSASTLRSVTSVMAHL
jgi:hypothetical protein